MSSLKEWGPWGQVCSKWEVLRVSGNERHYLIAEHWEKIPVLLKINDKIPMDFI